LEVGVRQTTTVAVAVVGTVAVAVVVITTTIMSALLFPKEVEGAVVDPLLPHPLRNVPSLSETGATDW
jgi:hypothetical protein